MFHFPLSIYGECLIELHSGELPVPLSYVCCLLRAGELLISYAFRDRYFRLPIWSRCHLQQQGCIAPLWYLALRICKAFHFVIVSSITLIVIHNRSSAYQSSIIHRSKRPLSMVIPAYGNRPRSDVWFAVVRCGPVWVANSGRTWKIQLPTGVDWCNSTTDESTWESIRSISASPYSSVLLSLFWREFFIRYSSLEH